MSRQIRVGIGEFGEIVIDDSSRKTAVAEALARESSSLGRMGIVARKVNWARKSNNQRCGSSNRRVNQSTELHLTRPGFIEGRFTAAQVALHSCLTADIS
jgi:hypothetical protein